MGGALLRCHRSQPRCSLGGVPFLVTQFSIEPGLAARSAAIRKLNHMPLPAARRLPTVQRAPPVFHCGIAARLAIALPGSAAPRRGPELRQVRVRARPGNLPEGRRLAPTIEPPRA